MLERENRCVVVFDGTVPSRKVLSDCMYPKDEEQTTPVFEVKARVDNPQPGGNRLRVIQLNS